ncbi:tetratricopeptide repeat protein, partial [Oscillatoriales cyanobacterium LEGE 11467]
MKVEPPTASARLIRQQSHRRAMVEPLQQQQLAQMALGNDREGLSLGDVIPKANPHANHHHQARIHASAGELSQAVGHYKKAISMQPNDPQLHYELGEIQHQQQDLAAARDRYERAIALQPDWAMAYYQLASVLTRQGERTDAIRCYELALDRFDLTHPHRLYAYNNLGCLLVGLEQFDEALAAYRAARSIDPKFVPLYNNLGKWWLLQGKFDRAIAAYHRAIELNPNRALTHYNLGKAYQKSDRHGEAVACFQRAMELQAGLIAAEIDCGFSLMELGERQAAFAYFHRAIARQPEWVEAYCQRMAQLVAVDDFDRARFATGQLIATLYRQPDSPDMERYLKETYTYLGRVQFDSGRYDGAADYYRKAAAIEPHDRELTKKLEECDSQQQCLQVRDLRIVDTQYPSSGALRDASTACGWDDALIPRGIYPTTRDWWMRSNLDSTHYICVHPAKQTTASPEPQSPSFSAEEKCQGLACHRCLKSTFDRWG